MLESRPSPPSERCQGDLSLETAHFWWLWSSLWVHKGPDMDEGTHWFAQPTELSWKSRHEFSKFANCPNGSKNILVIEILLIYDFMIYCSCFDWGFHKHMDVRQGSAWESWIVFAVDHIDKPGFFPRRLEDWILGLLYNEICGRSLMSVAPILHACLACNSSFHLIFRRFWTRAHPSPRSCVRVCLDWQVWAKYRSASLQHVAHPTYLPLQKTVNGQKPVFFQSWFQRRMFSKSNGTAGIVKICKDNIKTIVQCLKSKSVSSIWFKPFEW